MSSRDLIIVDTMFHLQCTKAEHELFLDQFSMKNDGNGLYHVALYYCSEVIGTRRGNLSVINKSMTGKGAFMLLLNNSES